MSQSHYLSIWPGYLTTIRHHEDGFLLGVEIIHKVLRRDSALDVMNRIRQSGGDIQVCFQFFYFLFYIPFEFFCLNMMF